MSDLLNQIGMRIWERRKQMRFTQEELAEKAGVTSQTISNAEHGTKALRPENIVKICTALEISTDYLLLGIENQSAELSSDEIRNQINNLSTANRKIVLELIKIMNENQEPA